MANYQIDETDRKILSFLVNNARMPYLEIARGCGISGAAVHQRVKKMEAMGIPVGTIPVGWWIGFLVTDEEVWEKVKDGTYTMFSIEGEAERVEVEEDGDSD